jgi:hypothetical protein
MVSRWLVIGWKETLVGTVIAVNNYKYKMRIQELFESQLDIPPATTAIPYMPLQNKLNLKL